MKIEKTLEYKIGFLKGQRDILEQFNKEAILSEAKIKENATVLLIEENKDLDNSKELFPDSFWERWK